MARRGEELIAELRRIAREMTMPRDTRETIEAAAEELEDLRADADNDAGALAGCRAGMRDLRELFARICGIPRDLPWPAWRARIEERLADRAPQEESG